MMVEFAELLTLTCPEKGFSRFSALEMLVPEESDIQRILTGAMAVSRSSALDVKIVPEIAEAKMERRINAL